MEVIAKADSEVNQSFSPPTFQSKHELIYVDRGQSEAPDRYLRIKDCTLAVVAEDDAGIVTSRMRLLHVIKIYSSLQLESCHISKILMLLLTQKTHNSLGRTRGLSQTPSLTPIQRQDYHYSFL